MEGKERQSLAAAGLMVGAAHTMRRAAIRLLWGIRMEMGGRQASAARIVIGVVLKQFVVQRWTWRQNTSILVSIPLVGTRRSAPYSRMGRSRALGRRWAWWGARPVSGGERRLMEEKEAC